MKQAERELKRLDFIPSQPGVFRHRQYIEIIGRFGVE